jgi:uncharacterized damage-inducible protein DinB
MNKNDLSILYDYNYWANGRVLAAAEQLTAEQLSAPAHLSHGSLRATLVHAMGAEIIWRLRCQMGIFLTTMPSEDEFPTLETLCSRWQQEERDMRAYLTSLTDSRLEQSLKYQSTKGIPCENTLWHLLAHVVNHGTQTRAEAAVGLTLMGHSPGDLDMILYFRTREQPL